jgi:hypothetical protein
MSWKPAPDEQEIVYGVLQRLGNRRLILDRHSSFNFPSAIRSLDLMRQDISVALGVLGPGSPLRNVLEDARADLQHFQTFLEDEFARNGRIDTLLPSDEVLEALSGLRESVGAKVAFLCRACDIQPSKGLGWNFRLPPGEEK